MDASPSAAPANDDSLQDIVLLGGGGHASDVLATIEFINSGRPTWNVIGVADDSDEPRLERFTSRGVPFLGPIDQALVACRKARFLATVGYPEGRRRVAERALRAGMAPATLIDPRAVVGAGTRFGEGCVVLGTRISPLCRIGRFVYVASATIVGHDTVIGDFCSLMAGCIVSGDVTIGDDVLVGISASVAEKRRLGARARIGAGAVVVRDVDPDTTVVGVPARRMPR
ncbi:MAG: acetyltransferase [Panacagrimonas sp.]